MDNRAMTKYGTNAPRGDIHILRDGRTAYCGEYCHETHDSFDDAKDVGRYSVCDQCGSAKHATDTAKGTQDVSTTGKRPADD